MGGVSLIACSLYSSVSPLHLTISGVLRHSKRAKAYRIRAKQGENEFLFGVLLSNLGKIGDRKRQKQRYILLSGLSWCCFHPLSWWRWWCPLGAGGQAFGVCPRSRGVFPPFSPLYCFTLVVSLANMALFRVLRAFLAWFGVFVWVCVVWVLCVGCGAFVRVYG